MSSFINKKTTAAALLAALLYGQGAHVALGQTNYYFQPAPDAPEADRLWQDGAQIGGDNWLGPAPNNFMFVPGAKYNERAFIENGATAVLTIDSPSDPNSDDSLVTPGSLQIRNGGLDIRSTGGLFVTAIAGSPGTAQVGGGGVGTLNIDPGGTLTADSSFTVTNDTSNFVSIGGLSGPAATLTASSAMLGGTTQLFPNADFTAQSSVSFAGTSVYRSVVTGASSFGMIDAGSQVSLQGALELEFDGYTPSTGDSWTVIEASSFTGSFSSVSLKADVADNQTLVVSQADLGGGRVGLNATLSEVLVLEVNRDTGTASITHPGSAAIQLDGYFIGSSQGRLSDDASAWDSISERGLLGGDWIETAQTSTNIGELKIGADATFGSDVDLGAIYNPLEGEFGVVDDLEFSYRRASDGAVFPGVVRYTGATANTLVLQVDPSGSGDVLLRNTSNTTVEIDAYEVLSDSGSLDAAGWNSLDDQAGPGNDWVEAGDIGANLLAEFDGEGFTTIAPGAALNLGPLFSGAEQDLEFNFLMMGSAVSSPGLVVYQGGIPGDFNQDGVVNAADYTVWRDNEGGPGIPNDDGLGVVDGDDYQLWRDSYGSTGSSGSSSEAVPEPTTLVGVVAGLLAVISARSRSRSAC